MTYKDYTVFMDIDSKLRHEIERYMRREHTNQTELAKRLDMTPQYLSDVMTGRRAKLPKSLASILTALNLELTVTHRDHDADSRDLPADLLELLEASGPLKSHGGTGKPQGSAVRLSGQGLVSDAVVDERNERSL